MAGFEIVVRPVVFPDIRPAPAQPVPPAQDPEQGFATIHGNGAKTVGLSYSYSSSISSSQRTETQRRVDEGRIYQMDDNGNVNKKNFVDIEAVNKVWMKGPPSQKVHPAPSGIPMTGDDLSGFTYAALDQQIDYYKKLQKEKNIEIRRQNVIKQNRPDMLGGGA